MGTGAATRGGRAPVGPRDPDGHAPWSLGALARHPATPAVLLVVGWLALLPLTRHYGNPDGPAYALVAERWLAGQLPEAVNAYWGPLLSWLAAPLLAVGVPALLGLRLVLLGGALATLGPLRTLARRAGASAGASQALLVAIVPFLLYNALFGLYADVLMNAAVLRAAALLARSDLPARPALALRAGAWCGAAFLARAYGAPVVLGLLPVAALLRWREDGPRAAGRSLALALAGLALVGGGWVAALSASSGELTVSTSAGFNAELVAPGSQGNPYNVPGLYEPARPDAMSAWEEPSQLPVPGRTEDPAAPDAADPGGAAATGGLAHRLELAVANLRIMVGSVLRRGAPVAALALLALGSLAARRRWPPPALSVPLAAGAIAAAGLPLIIAIERYLWLPILSALPAAAVGLDVATRDRPRLRPWLVAATIAVMAATSLHGLLPRVGAHAEVTAAADALAGRLDGRVATADSWQESHLLCFRVDCLYLGRPEPGPAAAVAAELRDADVDHLLVWRGDEDRVDDLPGEVPGTLTVYAVTDDGLRPRWHVHGDELRPAGE